MPGLRTSEALVTALVVLVGAVLVALGRLDITTYWPWAAGIASAFVVSRGLAKTEVRADPGDGPAQLAAARVQLAELARVPTPPPAPAPWLQPGPAPAPVAPTTPPAPIASAAAPPPGAPASPGPTVPPTSG